MKSGMNISLQKTIENYVPRDEQEEKDKRQMLTFIDGFDDVLTRNNTLGHFTASAFVVNKDKTKMLTVYHTISDGWAHPGGHADGEEDLLSVAVRETKEETGIDANVLSKKPFLLTANPVGGHIKHGEYVSSHIHFDVFYLMEADDVAPLIFRKDESKGVRWIPFDKINSEPIAYSIKPVVNKLISSLAEFRG